MRERRSKQFLWFLLLSLFLHFLFLLLIARQPVEQREAKLEPLDVQILKVPKRIADIAKPKEEERPKEADFVGLYDSRVKEEQVAATPPQPPGVPQPKQRATKPPEPKPAEPSKKDLAALFAMKQEQARERSAAAKPSWQRPGELPEDFYPDYKIGPHTYLNVLRFPDVQYFVRLKRIFKMTFNPIPVLRDYAILHQVAQGHVEVVLGVEVDPTGRLARLFVIRSSGFGGYDSEALRTVRDSSPFAKPPPKLLDPDGRLRMSWTFTVYL